MKQLKKYKTIQFKYPTNRIGEEGTLFAKLIENLEKPFEYGQYFIYAIPLYSQKLLGTFCIAFSDIIFESGVLYG